MSDPAMVQRAYTAVLQGFVESGRAPHYGELADLFGLDINVARELLRETTTTASLIGGTWLCHDTDNVESWAPFSNVPTHYLVSVDGVQKWYGQ